MFELYKVSNKKVADKPLVRSKSCADLSESMKKTPNWLLLSEGRIEVFKLPKNTALSSLLLPQDQ